MIANSNSSHIGRPKSSMSWIKGLIMCGQMRRPWIYIGTRNFAGTHKPSRACQLKAGFAEGVVLTAGLGGMGGAQPYPSP